MKAIYLVCLLLSSQIAKAEDCPDCNLMQIQQYQFQMPWAAPSSSTWIPPLPIYQAPWWLNYGAISYPQFNFPGAWAPSWGGGINPAMYPGSGGVGFDKPNIYVSGKAGSTFQIKVQMQKGSNWLAASPIHKETGWQGKLVSESEIMLNDAKYSYLYFDYRGQEEYLQDQVGFCADRKSLMPKLVDALKESGFKDSEIKDFVNYWTIKMPPANRYCVFPQGTAELDHVAKLDIQPIPKALIRLNFVIILQDGIAKNGDRHRKFFKEPLEAWNVNQFKQGERTPASLGPNDFVVREWGVAFLIGKAK